MEMHWSTARTRQDQRRLLILFIVALVLFTPVALMLATMAFVVMAWPVLYPDPDRRKTADMLARGAAVVVALLLGLSALLGIILSAEAAVLAEQGVIAASEATGPGAAPVMVHPLILLAVMAGYGVVLAPADRITR